MISAYPDEDWDSQRIWEAAARRAEVVLLAPTDFAAHIARGETSITAAGRDSRDYDLFLTPRAVGEEGDAEMQLELYRTLVESGARLVNEVGALTTAIDKFKSSWLFARAGLPTPPVKLVQTLEQARLALAELKEVVAKPVFGSLGIGVEKVASEERLAELLSQQGVLYLQAIVGEVERDVRAFVVGDRVEAAVARRPVEGEFRSNLRLGAAAEPVKLDATLERLAVAATRIIGLDYSGVDLLLTQEGPQLLEVNGTPSFRGLNQASGRDMAEAIVDHAIGLGRGTVSAVQGDQR